MPKAPRPHHEREERKLPPAAVGGSLVLHVAAFFLLIYAAKSMAAPVPPPTYRVQLVAASAPRAPEREKPVPAKVSKKENRPPPPQPTTRKKPKVKAPTQTEKKPRETPPSKEPARSEKKGEDAVNVQLDGKTFAYPDYLQNIIRQIYRYWRPPSGGQALRAEISFVIHRDGSVSDIEWIRRSGAIGFDLEARGAVEAAGRAKAFGSLPKGYPRDRLRVSFFFDPTSY
jgi:outer membrane biosynthesis protein TonB